MASGFKEDPKEVLVSMAVSGIQVDNFLPLVLGSNKCLVYLFACVKTKKIIQFAYDLWSFQKVSS